MILRYLLNNAILLISTWTHTHTKKKKISINKIFPKYRTNTSNDDSTTTLWCLSDICMFTLTSLGKVGSTSFSLYPMASYSLDFSFSLNSFSNCSSRIINNYIILSTRKCTKSYSITHGTYRFLFSNSSNIIDFVHVRVSNVFH